MEANQAAAENAADSLGRRRINQNGRSSCQESGPEIYERVLVPLWFRPLGRRPSRMCCRSRSRRERCSDVACGTGGHDAPGEGERYGPEGQSTISTSTCRKCCACKGAWRRAMISAPWFRMRRHRIPVCHPSNTRWSVTARISLLPRTSSRRPLYETGVWPGALEGRDRPSRSGRAEQSLHRIPESGCGFFCGPSGVAPFLSQKKKKAKNSPDVAMKQRAQREDAFCGSSGGCKVRRRGVQQGNCPRRQEPMIDVPVAVHGGVPPLHRRRCRSRSATPFHGAR